MPTDWENSAFALLAELTSAFDQEIYPEQRKEGFDAPDDREYSVTISARLWRRMGNVVTSFKPRAEAALESECPKCHSRDRKKLNEACQYKPYMPVHVKQSHPWHSEIRTQDDAPINEQWHETQERLTNRS